ncbi:MAG: hypothetical protein GXO11_07935 [Epsilonproteobacteria bacterium]|nr:hypothetical protein [Campylobacterota bacterium]
MAEWVMQYRIEIIFVHVFAAVIWVGGMISMRFAAHYAFIEITSPADRLEKTAIALGRLFAMVLPFVLLLAATGAILTIGYGIKHTDFHYLTHIKEGIWSVMFINLAMMMIRRKKALKALQNGDHAGAARLLGLIGKYMVPVNIALGIVAILFGVVLRTHL